MPRDGYSNDKLIPGAQGPAVLRYKSVVAGIEDLEVRGYGGPLMTTTFDNPCGKEGRHYDLLRSLHEGYWRNKGERLRYIQAVTPSTRNRKLYASHVLWQGELPDFRWIAGFLIQHSGNLAKHVYREGKPHFSDLVASDVLEGRFRGYEHVHGRVDVRISENVGRGSERVSPIEYFVEHSMTDETFDFESPFSRGRVSK